jgi:hypothetical protein
MRRRVLGSSGRVVSELTLGAMTFRASSGEETDAIGPNQRRMGVDHVDLHQVRACDPLIPPEQWLRTLDDLVRAEKVREVCVSNLNGWQLQREVEWELVDLCELEERGVEAWSKRDDGDLGAAWLEVTVEETARLDADSAPGLPDYPYSVIARAGATRRHALAPSGV